MNAHDRTWLSLDGLSVGDTFGECYFGEPQDSVRRIADRVLAPAPWRYTPLCLWVAARRSDDFAGALWDTVSALGDRDTTCAIVGGIVALKGGRTNIPSEWLKAREELPLARKGQP